MDLLTFFKYAGYVILIVGAITTVATSILTDRKDAAEAAQKDRTIQQIHANLTETKEMLAPFVGLAKKYFPGMSEADALDSLSKRMDLLDKEIKKTAAAIQSVRAKARIIFTGQWEKGKMPIATQTKIMMPVEYMTIGSGAKTVSLKTSALFAKAIDDHTVQVDMDLDVDVGDFPMGKQPQEVRDLQTVKGKILLNNPKLLADPIIIIREITVELFINRNPAGTLVFTQPIERNVSEYTHEKDYTKAAASDILFDINGSVKDLFKSDW